MKRRKREDLPDGGHTEIEWDDELGDFDLTEFDANGGFVRRWKRRYIDAGTQPGAVLAEDVYLAEDGTEIRRETITQHEPGATRGWS